MKVKKHYYKPFYVKVKNNNVDRALRELNKTLEANAFFDVLREKKYYIKPSEKRRKAQSLARYKWQNKKMSK